MATYITLIRFTAQGSKAIRQTCERAADFKAMARKSGVKVKETYWTLGACDGVLIFDAESEETATAAMLTLASQGNVQTQTCRAFNASEMAKILESQPQ